LDEDELCDEDPVVVDFELELELFLDIKMNLKF